MNIGFDGANEVAGIGTHTSVAVVGGLEEEHAGHAGVGENRAQAVAAANLACLNAHFPLDRRGRRPRGVCTLTNCVGER